MQDSYKIIIYFRVTKTFYLITNFNFSLLKQQNCLDFRCLGRLPEKSQSISKFAYVFTR